MINYNEMKRLGSTLCSEAAARGFPAFHFDLAYTDAGKEESSERTMSRLALSALLAPKDRMLTCSLYVLQI